MTSTNAALRIRRGKDGKLLLLGCPVPGLRGKIALGRSSCTDWHIAVRIDNFQHPDSIDFELSGSRIFNEYPKTDTKKYSKCYVVGGGPGEFDVLLRWDSGHSPYPEIRSMETWCFGVYMGEADYPKASDDYTTVAHVAIAADGFVTVNRRGAGIWQEFAGA